MTTKNHLIVSTEHVPTKEKAAPLATGTARKAALTPHNSTVLSPQQGSIDGYLLAQLTTLASLILLVVGRLPS